MRQVLTALLILLGIFTDISAKRYTISHLGVERGLSNNHVVGIAQDKNGFIWIATDEGLNRFDGYSFRTYLKDESGSGESLTGNELNAILDDPTRPVIWIATARGGLVAYDYSEDRFRSYRHEEGNPESLVTDDVTTLTPSSDGGLWVATFWRGFEHFNPDTGKFTPYSHENINGLPDAPVWSVMEGDDGRLYIGQERGGLSVVDLTEGKAVNYVHDPDNPDSLPSNDVEKIFQDSHNNIWVGTKSGLSLFNPGSGKFVNYGKYHPELRHRVSDIQEFADGRIWVAMERGGVVAIEPGNRTLETPDSVRCITIGDDWETGYLSNPSVRALFQDKYLNVWAGTWGGGLNLITGNVPAFDLHPISITSDMEDTSNAQSVLTLLVDDFQRLWIGKDSGGLYMQDKDDADVMFFPMKGSDGRQQVVQSSYNSHDGNLWFGLFFGGAYRYDEKTGDFSQVFSKEEHPDVRDIVADHDGNIIFGTSNGIRRYERSTEEMSRSFDVGNNLIRKVFPISGERFLIGTFGSGLILTDSEFRELSRNDVASGFPSNTVNDIFRSRDGHVWVATGEGLLEYADIEDEPTEYKVYNRATGLSNSHVLAIVQDRKGEIWVSTNGGISCIKDNKVYNFTNRDNVPLGNFLGHSVATDSLGNLYFGSISGLCRFNPTRVFEKVDLPSPMIVEITVADDSGSSSDFSDVIPVAGKEKVRLSSDQNTFDVSFTTGDFSLAHNVEYSYMLEGVDDRWINTHDDNSVTFRNLPAGTYVFKVKTRVRNQEWGEPAELKIVIPPPFYLSWWAKLIYVATAVGIISALLYLYQKRIIAEARLKAEQEKNLHEQELNEERLRFYTNITHELRTPLTLIMGPLDDMSREKSLNDRDKKSLSMVRRNASRLLDLVNRLLEFRKTETQNRKLCVRKGNIAATVYEVVLKYKELNRNHKVAVNVTTESGDMEAVYDKEVVTMVLDNLMSNALKYTREGSVDISCMEKEGQIIITVKDTGLGISHDAVDHIFDRYYQEKGPHQAAGTGIGLALVKNLVDLHHGVISVKSEEGIGTEFTVAFPVNDAYPEALHVEEPGNGNVEVVEISETTVQEDGNLRPLVLVVEDNADIRDYVKQAFTDLYDIRTAENGKEGLDLARVIMPAVIVSDIMMPEMDGIEMTRHLKNDVRTSHIPIILLTAKGTIGDREEGYVSGADSYLVKPFNSSLLQARINNLLHQRAKLQEKFSSSPGTVNASDDEDLERKREKLLKSLSEVDRKFIEKLTKTITDNLPAENVDVNFLSGVFCMSVSTLYRKVKALTGLSPNEYIRKIKMQMAEELLLQGNLTFSEIAFKVGINSVAYFRSCFKDEFGMTPTEYMKRIASKSSKN